MATSGLIPAASNTIGQTELYWNRTSYSVAENKSTIAWVLRLVITTSGTQNTYNAVNYTVKIDNNEYKGTVDGIVLRKVGTQIIATGTTTISHAADGTKSFSCSFTFGNGVLGTYSGYSTETLNPIPKKATISSAVDFNDEENPTITYTNISGNLVTRVEACISLTGAKDDVPYREISKTGTSYTFNLTNSERTTLRAAITSGNSRTVRFYVRTTIGTETFHSYLSKTLTLVNYKPILYPSVADGNSTTAMLTGDTSKIVRYYSNARVVFASVPRKGATIVRKTATNGSQSVVIEDSQEVAVINNVEDNVFNLSVTDSRGYTTSEQIHFKGDNFIPYFDVTCVQTIRLNLDKTIDLTVKGSYYDGSFGALDNELIIETRHNENGGEWSDWEAITPLVSDISNGTYTLNATISGYDPSGSYGFQCRAIDKLSTAESAIETVTLEPLFDWSKYDFNFNVPVTIESNPLADFVVETGTEAMGTNGTWYWSKWKSGKAECYGCRNFGKMTINTAWGGHYRSGIFTQDLPSGLFLNTPEVIDISIRDIANISLDGGVNSGCWVVRHEESAADSGNTGSFVVVRAASGMVSPTNLSFNIIGRWK